MTSAHSATLVATFWRKSTAAQLSKRHGPSSRNDPSRGGFGVLVLPAEERLVTHLYARMTSTTFWHMGVRLLADSRVHSPRRPALKESRGPTIGTLG